MFLKVHRTFKAKIYDNMPILDLNDVISLSYTFVTTRAAMFTKFGKRLHKLQ